MKKRILVFTAPFSGHLNILKEIIRQNGTEHEFQLVITGWTNITADTSDVSCAVTTLAKSELHETDPALWTLPRAAELLPDCLELVRREKPDLIIYDFFSAEAFFVARELGIPHWCSIPAFHGAFDGREYLDAKLTDAGNRLALRRLAAHLDSTVDPNRIEMASDGLLFPGELNLVWSYRDVTPANFMDGRQVRPYVFVGHPRGQTVRAKPSAEREPVVYVSLGTVVLDNLWNNQAETRERLKEFTAELARLWSARPWRTVFVTQGKELCASYPSSWTVVDRADQVRELSRAKAFVTHGGSNSFHEAIEQHVPMAVIPFFGDQPLVARRAQELGIGLNLGTDDGIDTKKPKNFVGRELARNVDHAVAAIMSDDGYAARCAALELRHESIRSLLADGESVD
jgi:MGT family glycosyltransferase